MFPVSLNNFHFEDWQFTFNLASGITEADEGKAVALDTSAANTVKLAGDGDEILGRLERVENRVQAGLLLGTVSIKFGAKLPIASGETVAVGDFLIGAGGGEVKAAPALVTDGGTNTHASHPRRIQVMALADSDANAVALAL